MGNSQKFCPLGFTANQSDSAENVRRHFQRRYVSIEQQESLTNEKREEQQFIRIKTTTWDRNTHSLFDYDSNNSEKAIFKIKSSGSLVYDREHVCFRRKNLHLEDPSTLFGINQDASELIPPQKELFKIRKEFGRFYLQQRLDAERKPTRDSNWVVVKSVQRKFNNGFQLIESDYFRLGCMNFKVREINESGKLASSQINKIIEEETKYMSEEPTTILSQKKDGALKKKMVSNKKDKSQDPQPESTICRICLSEQTDKDNPLVNPCKCTGSMKLVHIKCMQNLIRIKVEGSVPYKNCINLRKKFFECEICKMKLQFKFTYDGKLFDILDIFEPEDKSPYVILDIFNEGMQLIGVCFLLLIAKNTFTIGRTSTNDICVSEISLSRKHAVLIYDAESHQLCLKDNDSKFGSLVLMRDDLEISSGLQNVQIQNEGTLAEFLPRKSICGILSSYFGIGENQGVKEFSE